MTEPEAHPDRLLVDAALRRDLAAVEELAQRLRCIPRILAAWNGRLGRPMGEHDLADLAQDVSIIVLQKLGEYAGRGAFEAWVYRICRLELLNGMRRAQKRRALSEVELDELSGDDATGDAGDEAEALHAALQRLGGAEAEIIRLKHFDGLTFEEIGARTQLAVSTAKTRYYAGMQRLQGWFGGGGRSAEGER